MKIGIVTIFDCVNNSGAFLQAYSLKLFLEKKENDVYHIVKPKKDNFVNKSIRNRLKDLKPEKGLSLIQYIKKCVKLFLFVVDYKKREFVCRKDLKKMNTISVEQANAMNLDCIICGSDEIWNLRNTDVGDEFYFAKNVSAKKKVAYAACIGDSSSTDLINAEYPLCEMKKFDVITARDENTRKILKEILGKSIDKVCDPTLLVNMEELHTKTKRIQKKYILVYSYYVPGNIKKHIINYARKNNLEIVAPVIYQNFADINLFVSPTQFIDLVKNAECIYTSTLHGSIFSIISKKRTTFLAPFSKVKEIIESFGQTDRILGDNPDYNEFEKIMDMPPSTQIIDDKVLKMREESQKCMEEILLNL